MLSPETIKKIKKIHIKSSHTVNTVMAGHYKSVFRGSGVEFEEVREYSPGDEIKSIDWKVSARMGRPFVKLYREERERVVMLLLDVSASTRFGTTESLKSETAAEIASVIAFNAIRNNDKVGAILFTDRVEKYIPPKKGPSHVWRVIKEFFSFEPSHRETDVTSAVAYLGRVARKKTVSFLISDFISPSYARELRVAAKKHEIIGVLISDPGEFRLPEKGIISVKGLESGTQLLLDASDLSTEADFRKFGMKSYRETVNTLTVAGIDHIPVMTSDSVAEVLVRYFRKREKSRRL